MSRSSCKKVQYMRSTIPRGQLLLHTKKGSNGALEIDCEFTGNRSSLLPNAELSAHGSYTRKIPPSFFTDGKEIRLNLPRFRYTDERGARKTLSCRPYFMQQYKHQPLPVLIVLYILKLCKTANMAVETLSGKGHEKRRELASCMLSSNRGLIVRSGLSFSALRTLLGTVRRFLLDSFGSVLAVDACMDRLCNGPFIVNFTGKSYRCRAAEHMDINNQGQEA